jgi:hypothetical protein
MSRRKYIHNRGRKSIKKLYAHKPQFTTVIEFGFPSVLIEQYDAPNQVEPTLQTHRSLKKSNFTTQMRLPNDVASPELSETLQYFVQVR